jgi:hypothetical protein
LGAGIKEKKRKEKGVLLKQPWRLSLSPTLLLRLPIPCFQKPSNPEEEAKGFGDVPILLHHHQRMVFTGL